MELPPMLRAAYPQAQQQQQMGDGQYLQHSQLQQHQQRLLMQQRAAQGQLQEIEASSVVEAISNTVSNGVYGTIDYCGKKFKKVAPYVNKTLQYGWVPVVVYFGLKQGTHKYYPNEQSNVSADMMDQQLERVASWTDAIPLIGSHGSPKAGLLPSM